MKKSLTRRLKVNLENLLDKAIVSFALIFLAIVFVFNFGIVPKATSHFSHLAESFLQGKTFFTSQLDSWIDTAFFAGKHFWPAGPFPAILLMPFVYFFGTSFHQGFVQPLLVIAIFFLIYKISKRLKYPCSESLFLAFCFCFSSVFINVSLLPESWAFSQVVTTLILSALILLYLNKSSTFIIGFLLGLASATRLTSASAVLFFLLVIFSEKLNLSLKLKKLFSLLAPFLAIMFLLGYYDLVRFGNFFEQGYSMQILSHEALKKARNYGLTSPTHIPANLYYFLLSTPIPIFLSNSSHILKFPYLRANPWGMSIFITSPIFLYLFLFKFKDSLSKILIVSIIASTIPIFFYYGIGVRQVGYRYSLDFLPFLFFLLIRNYQLAYKKLSINFKLIILLTSLSNFYFFVTAYFYP